MSLLDVLKLPPRPQASAPAQPEEGVIGRDAEAFERAKKLRDGMKEQLEKGWREAVSIAKELDPGVKQAFLIQLKAVDKQRQQARGLDGDPPAQVVRLAGALMGLKQARQAVGKPVHDGTDANTAYKTADGSTEVSKPDNTPAAPPPIVAKKEAGEQEEGPEGVGSANADRAPAPAKPAKFVPKMKWTTARQRSIAQGERIALPLRILNYADLPKGTAVEWGVSIEGASIDAEISRTAGEGVVTVSGVAGGKAVLHVEIKIGAGESGVSYRSDPTSFDVIPLSAADFIPQLQLNTAATRGLMVREKASIQMRVVNWAMKPESVTVDWEVSVAGAAIDVELRRSGGEGWIDVVGVAVGDAVLSAGVKVGSGGGGRTYPAPSTAFKVAPLASSADPSVSDEGGLASVTDLEQDMRNLLQDWKSAATDGVNQFVGSELSKRLDDLEGGSGKSFVVALLGNTMWAAAAFSTGGAAFGLSMAGIAVAAGPTVPSSGKSAIPQIQKLMMDYIYGVHGQLDKLLRSKAQILYDTYPRYARFRAMGLFMTESFKGGMFQADSGAKSMPSINMGAIRDVYAQKAKFAFDREVAKWSNGPLGTPEFQHQVDEAVARSSLEEAKKTLAAAREALPVAKKEEERLRPYKDITKSDDGPLASPNMQWRLAAAELEQAKQKLADAEKKLVDAEANLVKVQASIAKARKEENEL